MRTLLTIVLISFTACVTSQSEQENYQNLIALADSTYSINHFEVAQELYDSLSKLFPENGEYFYKLGYSHSLILNYKKANDAYLSAANLGYRTADALYNAGINETLLLNDSLAIIYFKRSLKLNPNDSDAYKELQNAKLRISQ